MRRLLILIALMWPIQVHAQVARAGTPVAANREGSAGTTLTTASQAVTTGNTLVVVTGIYSPGAEEISSVTDSGGVNVYTAGTACESAGNNRLRAFYSVGITGGTLTFTVTPSASVDYIALVVSEYSGVRGVDVEVPCATGVGTTMTSGTFSTSTAGMIHAGGISANSSAATTAGTNFTLRTDNWFNSRAMTEDRITTAALASTTATIAQDVNEGWLIGGWSFIGASGGLTTLGAGR